MVTKIKEEEKTYITEDEFMAEEMKIPLLEEEIFWSSDDPRWNEGEDELYRNEGGHDNGKDDYLFYGNATGKSNGRVLDMAEDSYIWCYAGPRGAGKTSYMTYLAEKCAYLYDKRIISNYPIEFRVRKNGGISHYKSEPLELGKLLMFDESYTGCIIVLDEAPQVINRLATMTWKNRLLDLWLQQIRKNGNSLLYGSQNEGWVDNELRWQTDVIAYCRDASRRYPNSGHKRGSMIIADLIDKSGMWTGYSYDERPRKFGRRMLTELIWGTFDTHHQQDVFESLSKVKMNVGNIEVGVKGGDDNSYLEYSIPIIQQSMETGRIKTPDFYNAIGNGVNKQELGMRLRDSGVKDTGSHKGTMDFSGFDMNKFMTWTGRK